jgi:hypothetical protein
MKTQREYLASKGLAIAGARGRFSKEAKAELERVLADGMQFSDGKAAALDITTLAVYPKLREYPVLRDLNRIHGYTVEGALVSSDICFKCAMHVSRCACSNGITASKIVSRWSKKHKKYGAPIDPPEEV